MRNKRVTPSVDQGDLFAWAESRPSNIIDAVPAIVRRIRIERAYRIPKRECEGKLIEPEFRRERTAA